jgi:hypothetical protein
MKDKDDILGELGARLGLKKPHAMIVNHIGH